MMPRWLLYALLVVGLIACFAPVYGIYWSTEFADLHGCALNEAGVHPCIVDGKDVGPELAEAFTAGWLMLVTIPIVGMLLMTLVVFSVQDNLRRRRAGQK